jgi:precorrin-6B methylase 2
MKDSILATLDGYYGDKKLGIDTGYYDEKVAQGKYGDSETYQPTKYSILQKIIEYLKLNKDDVFVDFGCGKGRVIAYLASQRLKKVIGIELDEKMVNIARVNINNLKSSNTPIEIINIDATSFNPTEGTVFFIYNSFGEKTLNTVINNIKDSLTTSPRAIRIVYSNPVFKIILKMQDWLEPEGVIDCNGFKIFVWHNKYFRKS